MSRKKPSKEILQQVSHEIAEHLSAMEAILLRLGDRPDSAEDLSELFRSMHTIKGVASVLERPGLVDLAHHAENLLSGFRDGRRPVAESELDLLLQAKDALGRILRGEDPDVRELMSKLSGGLPHAMQVSGEAGDLESESEEPETESMFVVFRVRGRLCALPAERIAEVSQILPWRTVPFTRESFCGMASLRGQLVPVLDPAPMLDLAGRRPDTGRILFLETGEEFTGVLVDRVLGVHPLPGWQRSRAALRHFGVDLVDAVASFRDEGVVAILSTDRLLELASA